MPMPSCCNRMLYAKTRITMLITALHSGQLPPSSATPRAQFSQNLACPKGTKANLPSVPTDILRNTVMVCLQQLALLAPTLRPTRWQQSVSTARRRRRRNCRRVGWAVARRCERQRRGSQQARTAACRTHYFFIHQVRLELRTLLLIYLQCTC